MIRQADEQDSARSTGCRLCRILVGVGVLALLVGTLYVAWRFGADRPVDYAAIEDHFKYGSTGGEREAGFPYWLWRPMPHVCHDKLPAGTQVRDQEYKVFGLLYEGDKDLPIGVSKRRHFGLDRIFLNCAVCHTSTVREKPESTPLVVTGMPANTVRLMEFEKFMFDCAKDGKFSRDYIIPEVRRLGGKLDLIDRYLVSVRDPPHA
ncbi:MAG: hypothetical protein ICV76_06200 [Nitrospiraceae bacterium]|nr:hypothetical protein [Nitrospiraceae bacterium]